MGIEYDICYIKIKHCNKNVVVFILSENWDCCVLSGSMAVNPKFSDKVFLSADY